ncbi:biotin transporter BioY [Thomasclavelia cocleata]|uniref:biotin transporter BioY n=1 Tax=Thomasclavelia cocleata TaxID=69824 RepID=UPI00258C80A9|nr:biotin transporter BioY [Thomasclavelia cocleata]
MNPKVKNMCYCSMFACSVALLAQIKIDLPGLVPITLQTLGIYIIACSLTPKLAVITTIVYVIMGAIGLPVFTGFRGGLSSLLEPTGGYIFSFPITSLIISIIINNKNSIIRKIIAMITGTAVCYLIGTIWFIYATNNTIITALTVCVIPFIFGDIIKIVIASTLSTKIKTKL